MAASNNKCRIKSGDEVLVITGKDRGRVGRVVRVLPSERRVVVDGVARVVRHRRPVGDAPGGMLEKEMSIDISNVALWDSTEKRRVKVAYRVGDDGRKIRVDRKTNRPLDSEPAAKE